MLSTLSAVILLADDDEDEEENGILQRAGGLISEKTDHLPKGILDIGKLNDANCSKPFLVSEIYLRFPFPCLLVCNCQLHSELV